MIDESVQSTIAAFGARIHANDYPITPGSPWPSELIAVVATAKRHGVTLIIEGGTSHGQSAWVFGTFGNVDVITYDTVESVIRSARTRFALEFRDGQVSAHVGDAYERIPMAVKNVGCLRPHGVFLDGPKGTASLVLVQQLLEMDVPAMKFIAVHDTYASTMGRPNPVRYGLMELGTWTPGWKHWTSDDATWDATRARALDIGLYAQHRRLPHGWEPFRRYVHGVANPMPSYGPTVTILERKS